MVLRVIFRLLAVILITLIFTTCGSDDKDSDSDIPIEFEPSEEFAYYLSRYISIAESGDTLEFSFTCNKEWSVSSSEDWCHVSPQNGGSGNNTITINVKANELLDKRISEFEICVDDIRQGGFEIRQDGSSSGIVYVENAGTLSSLLVNSDLSKIKNLTISGELNGTDIIVLQKMKENLVALDLTDASIVGGGDVYYNSNSGRGAIYTENNIFPPWSLCFFKKLEEIKMPTTIEKIDDDAFAFCYNLRTIEIPQNINKLGNSVFRQCESLDSVSLPNGIRCIPQESFYCCYGLKHISLPTELDSIGLSAFSKCTALEEIQLNEGLKFVEGEAFSGCTSLKRINIPESVTTIGMWAFYNCSSLEELTLYEGVENCTSIFGNCGIKKLTLHFKKLNRGLLNGCPNLETLILNEGMVLISDYSLRNLTNLKELTLPSTVNEIGEYAFCDNSLEFLHLKSEVPPTFTTSSSYTKNYYSQCTLYVPKGCKELYINQGKPWTLFKEIIEE